MTLRYSLLVPPSAPLQYRPGIPPGTSRYLPGTSPHPTPHPLRYPSGIPPGTTQCSSLGSRRYPCLYPRRYQPSVLPLLVPLARGCPRVLPGHTTTGGAAGLGPGTAGGAHRQPPHATAGDGDTRAAMALVAFQGKGRQTGGAAGRGGAR